MSLQNLSVAQLRKLVAIKEEIERLEAELESLSGGEPAAPKTRKKRRMSASARARIAAAQRARWAKVHAAAGKSGAVKKKGRKRRKMSPAAKAKLAAIAKARWARVKAAGKSTL